MADRKITGVPGSPSATTTTRRKATSAATPQFGGVIKESAKDSKPWWPPRVVPPKGAPNMLLIMTDDQGYGVSSTFGGVIPTPALDRIAKSGLRYTQFHSTALCSPTRAALITGRNHHSVGFGVISELSTGYPGYDSIISPENATIGTILKDNGYATSWFGKNHNTPAFQYSVAGPFNQWPSGMGFEYFYGFMGGETDQWTPYLFRDHTQIFPWIGSRTTTSPPTWRMRQSTTWTSSMPPRPTNHSSSITCPAAATRRTSRRRNGSTSSRASSTWAGMPCASRSSPTRNDWALSRQTRNSPPGRMTASCNQMGFAVRR